MKTSVHPLLFFFWKLRSTETELTSHLWIKPIKVKTGNLNGRNEPLYKNKHKNKTNMQWDNFVHLYELSLDSEYNESQYCDLEELKK